MDTIFWVGLGLGALVSIPISIAANLWTDAVRNFLDKRKRIRLSNKKSKEVRTYFFVRALREGDPTAKVLLDIDATFSNRSAIFAGMCLGALMCFLLVALHPIGKEHPFIILGTSLSFMVFLIGFHSWSMTLHWKLAQIRRRLMWFHDYETNIRVKWGDDALEEMQMAAAQNQREILD
jgi:hypothetical protein